MDRLIRLAALACLFAAGGYAATPEERLARGEVVVRRLPAERGGILGGESRGVIAAPLERVWAVLNRSGEFADYMPNYLASWLIDRAALTDIEPGRRWQRAEMEAALQSFRLADWASDTVLFYNVLDMPFPVSDRWYLLAMWRDTATHSVCWNQLIGNLESNKGSWELQAWPDSAHTLAIYTTISEPGIALPRFILDIGLNQSLPGVIKGLRKRVMRAGQ